MDRLVTTVQDQLNALAPGHRKFLVATSGGPDSQCLLHIMGTLKSADPSYRVHAAGVDHGFRAEASEELEHARELARRLNIPFVSGNLDVPKKGNKLANARDARYQYLTEQAIALENAVILTAHTSTDQLETVLINISRGSGLRGAAGVPAARESVLRPLLGITRPEVMHYLVHHGLSYALDPSNNDPDRARAKLREKVIPTLRELNLKAEKHFSAFAHTARLADEFLDQEALKWSQLHRQPAGGMSLGALEAQHPALRTAVVARWLRENALTPSRDTIGRILDLAERNESLSVDGKLVECANGNVWLHNTQPYEHNFSIPGSVSLRTIGMDLSALRIENHTKNAKTGDYRSQARKFVAFDLDHLHLDLVVRAWQPGDRMRPFGMQGSVTIGDLFTNLKVARPLRLQWPVLTAGDEVIWVVGLRRSAVADITQETRDVVQFECHLSDEWAQAGLLQD